MTSEMKSIDGSNLKNLWGRYAHSSISSTGQVNILVISGHHQWPWQFHKTFPSQLCHLSHMQRPWRIQIAAGDVCEPTWSKWLQWELNHMKPKKAIPSSKLVNDTTSLHDTSCIISIMMTVDLPSMPRRSRYSEIPTWFEWIRRTTSTPREKPAHACILCPKRKADISS